MSISAYRDEVMKRLQEKVDEASNRAINMPAQAFNNADLYALTQVDTLATARAYAEAARIVMAEYKRLVEVATPPAADEKQQKKENSIYG